MSEANQLLNKSADQGVSVIKTWAPPMTGLAIGWGVGDLLGLGGVTESFLTKYTDMDVDAIGKLSSIVVIAAYLGVWASMRKSGLIGKTVAWTGLGVTISESLTLKDEVVAE